MDTNKLTEYTCHKVVRACKIKEVVTENGVPLIVPVDDKLEKFKCGSLFVNKHNPKAGGYYVVYKDGYASYSPADVFEEGYTKGGSKKGSKKSDKDGDDEELVMKAAKTAHEVNRAYCESIGDSSQKPWDKAPKWQKESSINGVIFLRDNPKAGPEHSHDNWMREKEANGWKFGEKKDEKEKTHPCMVPYNQLSDEHKAKDALFTSVVRSILG